MDTVVLLTIGIVASLGPPIVGAFFVIRVLLSTARDRFPDGSKHRTLAQVVAAVTSIASIGFVAYAIYAVYEPTLTGEKGATNGLILLFGPTFMGFYALLPAGMVIGVLMLWSWILGRKTDGT